MRSKLMWVLGSCSLIGLSLAGLLVLRSTRRGGHLLWASKPFFSQCTNAERIQPIVWFVVSNPGPSTIKFHVPWHECRRLSDLSFLEATLRPGAGSRPTLLSPASMTNVAFNLVEAQATNSEMLFCCQITWVECESALTEWGRKVDKPMYWLGAVLGFNWNSPWRQKSLVCGDVFKSNVDVAGYFCRTYGLTRERWLEEQRLEQKRQAELARIRANRPPGQGFGYFSRRIEPLTAQEEVELAAKAAFARFCQASTNEIAATEPDDALPVAH